MKALTSSEVGSVMKTLSAIWITVACSTVGVIIARVALACAIVMFASDILFH